MVTYYPNGMPNEENKEQASRSSDLNYTIHLSYNSKSAQDVEHEEREIRVFTSHPMSQVLSRIPQNHVTDVLRFFINNV